MSLFKILFKILFRTQWDYIRKAGSELQAAEHKLRELRTALVACKDAQGVWRDRATKAEARVAELDGAPMKRKESKGDAFRVRVIESARSAGLDIDFDELDELPFKAGKSLEMLKARVAELELHADDVEESNMQLGERARKAEARVAELEAEREPRPMPSAKQHPEVQALVTLTHRGYGDHEEEWEDLEGNPFSLDLCDGWLPVRVKEGGA